jgi:hypothetical protein
VGSTYDRRVLVRYGILVFLIVVATRIAPGRFGDPRLVVVVSLCSFGGLVVVSAAPRRFAYRRATPALQLVWWVFVAEVVALSSAFVLGVNPNGSVGAAAIAGITALALEIWLRRRETAAHLAFGSLVRVRRPERPDAFVELAAGPLDRAYTAALTDAYEQVPTVVRAYLVTGRYGPDERRVLALRYAYPWPDEDALVISQQIFRHMFGAGPLVDVVTLDDAVEHAVHAIAAPFYVRQKVRASE